MSYSKAHPARNFIKAGPEVVAETEHQGLGAQREPGRNVHAVW
jgi:hypothetical protein